MGWIDLGDFGREKWMLKEFKKKQRKKRNGRKKHSKCRNLVLLESLEQIVWDWNEREKSEPTKRIDFVDVYRNALVGSE